MSEISLFTSINYTRPSSCAEQALSALSNYFYLGGDQAVVFRDDEARLENGESSWCTIALKVASYILFFPLTLPLLAINVALLSQYHFTVISPLPLEQESTPISTEDSQPASSSQPVLIPVENSQPAMTPHRVTTTSIPPSLIPTAMTTAQVGRSIIAPPHLSEIPFQPFNIKILNHPFSITSAEEMQLKIDELGQCVFKEHIQLTLHVPEPYSPQRSQAMQFLAKLQTVANVTQTRWAEIVYITPKRAQSLQESPDTICRYENGVVETVQSKDEYDWEGQRIYPNGLVETGKFRDFWLKTGTYSKEGVTTYRYPDKLFSAYALDRHLMYIGTGEERQLIIIRTKDLSQSFISDYVQVDEELIPTLANILKETNQIRSQDLQDVLSGPIDCREFVQFLFATNAIFSLKSYPLKILLEIISERRLVVNLHQQHSDTGKTLLDCYAGNVKILTSLLTIDPSLAQRTAERELTFLQALLAGNKKGAILFLQAQAKVSVALSPREQLFKKVAFSEGEVTLEELQALPWEDQEIVYRLANIYSQLPVLQMMRTVGFARSEELLMREGPSIFGCNMDALEMYEQLHAFLKNLRSQRLLLTRAEFSALPQEKHVSKGSDIGRILGRDYIERQAHLLGLQHVKVPKKMIVISDIPSLGLRTSRDLSIKGDDIEVYAERIEPYDRQITAEEVYELLLLFTATGYTDIHWSNIIVAKDGVYIIDTEFTNFWVHKFYFERGRQYHEMVKIVHALPTEQQQEILNTLQEKIVRYRQEETTLEAERTLQLKTEKAALQKSGCIHTKSFSFSVDDLLT